LSAFARLAANAQCAAQLIDSFHHSGHSEDHPRINAEQHADDHQHHQADSAAGDTAAHRHAAPVLDV
jgi:hypothetical protein